MKTLLVLGAVFFFALLEHIRADCTTATDTDVHLESAGYKWQFAAGLESGTESPGTPMDDKIDLYIAGRSLDGAYNLSMRVVIPRKEGTSTQQLWLSNGYTTEISTGKKVFTAYRLVIWLTKGPKQSANHQIIYLMPDGEDCLIYGPEMGFAADDVRAVAVDRLVKL